MIQLGKDVRVGVMQWEGDDASRGEEMMQGDGGWYKGRKDDARVERMMQRNQG